jgi:hypothetical protein
VQAIRGLWIDARHADRRGATGGEKRADDQDASESRRSVDGELVHAVAPQRVEIMSRCGHLDVDLPFAVAQAVLVVEVVYLDPAKSESRALGRGRQTTDRGAESRRLGFACGRRVALL